MIDDEMTERILALRPYEGEDDRNDACREETNVEESPETEETL
jgi:hypothetical protein